MLRRRQSRPASPQSLIDQVCQDEWAFFNRLAPLAMGQCRRHLGQGPRDHHLRRRRREPQHPAHVSHLQAGTKTQGDAVPFAIRQLEEGLVDLDQNLFREQDRLWQLARVGRCVVDQVEIDRLGSRAAVAPVPVDDRALGDPQKPRRDAAPARIKPAPGSPRSSEDLAGDVLSLVAIGDPGANVAPDRGQLGLIDLDEVQSSSRFLFSHTCSIIE
jgi:hypothetical protein